MDNSRRDIVVDRAAPSRSGGSVLLIVMMIITTVLAVALSRNGHLLTYYNELTSLEDGEQGYIYCVSALKGITILLAQDMDNYDSSESAWAKMRNIPIDHGNINITVIPLESKVSLLGLSSSKEIIVERTKEAMVNLIPQCNDSLIDVIKKGSFFSIEALLYGGIKDIKPKDVQLLTVEDTLGKININFAPLEILRAYLPEIEGAAEDIIEYRKEKPFKDISQIRRVPGISDSAYLTIMPYITVRSSMFYVYTEALIRDTKTSVSAIIQRNDAGKVKIIKYFEKVNEYYVYNRVSDPINNKAAIK